MEKRISNFSLGLIWFGAAISLAEMLTGTYFAPLGLAKGLWAIVLGHIIGGGMMFCAGLIGAREGKSAMETVKLAFGEKGSLLFSFLNVLQLVGWTAIMILNGSLAAYALVNRVGLFFWQGLIGVLIVLWIVLGVKRLRGLNTVAMVGLLILGCVLSFRVFDGSIGSGMAEAMSFGAAVELAVAMPLSWLPLISDYTRMAEKPFGGTAVSVGIYTLASIWMYAIGLVAALYTGESDIAQIILSSGMGVWGLLIVIFSTVTTTFLDANSAGVSMVSIKESVNEKAAAVVVCIAGTLLAMFTPIGNMESFLYVIGSVFAPMIAIQIADYFILHKRYDEVKVSVKNICLWGVGFLLYRYLMQVDIVVGNTLPVMVIVIIAAVIVEKLTGGKKYV